jgi:hypothetical protein
MLNKYKIRAYATLVKAGKYILDEADRETESQLLVPEDYVVAVAEYLVTQ